LKRHAETLRNYFAHPVTNAVAEGPTNTYGAGRLRIVARIKV
jgi:transposase